MAEEVIKYDAFISYRHCLPDKEIAIKLHKALENYRLPHAIAKKIGRRKVERVFRDEAELAVSSELSAEIEKALLNSEYLIVVCTPRLRLSEWCMKEIETFLKISDRDHILLVLAEGEPDEAFPEIMMYEDVEKTSSDGQIFTIREKREPLAGDCRGTTNKKRREALKNTVLRLCAVMFGVRFDDLKNRQKERQMRTNAVFSGLIFLVVFCVAAQNTYFLIEQSKQNAVIQEKLATITANASTDLLEDGRRKDAIYVAKSVLPDNPENGFNLNAYRALQNAMGIYSQPDLFTAEKNISIFPEYVRFNYDASMIASWNTQEELNILDSETEETLNRYPLLFNSEIEFYGKDSLLHYASGTLVQINVSTNLEKEIKIPKTNGDSEFKHLYIVKSGEERAVLLQDGIAYGIIDGVCKYKIDITSLNLDSGNTAFNDIVFSEDGQYAIAWTYQSDEVKTVSIVEFKTDTGEILSTYETNRIVVEVAPVKNGFYFLQSNEDETDYEGTEVLYFDNAKGRLIYNQYFANEYYYAILCIGDTVSVFNTNKMVVMDLKLQVLDHLQNRFCSSAFSYKGNLAFIIEDGTAYIWSPETQSLTEKSITSEKVEISSGDLFYLDENKYQVYHTGSDYVTVYKKNVTDCLVEMEDYSVPDDYFYDDEVPDELLNFVNDLIEEEGIPVIFKGIADNKKYYVVQMKDFQTRFYDIETKECVKKSYIEDKTLWKIDYCEKYDCYFLAMIDVNGTKLEILDSDLNHIASLSNFYIVDTDGGIDGDPVIFTVGGDNMEFIYYSLNLLTYEEVMKKADSMLNGYVPDSNTLEKYGLTP